MLSIQEIKEVNKNGFNSKYLTAQNYTIIIGRNIKSVPMNKRKWKGFKSCLEMFIENHKSEVFVNSEGCGVWEGIKEKNNTYVFSTKNPLDLDRLERISKLFKQDAIALIAGCNTQFIG